MVYCFIICINLQDATDRKPFSSKNSAAKAAADSAEEKFAAAQVKQKNAEAGIKQKERASQEKTLKNGFAALGGDDDDDEN